MGVPTIFFLVALVVAVIEEFQAQGRSLVGWAAILICVGLLWGDVITT